ncbi:MAG TPA: transglycosylase domain-containing protein, partial [Thermodesulfovibrionales bacterium]|nr:transglycosylase domain-containing protein [Thermodesulfovibrionales bacterium]
MNTNKVFYYFPLSVFFSFCLINLAHALPSFDEVKNSYKKSDAVLLDRHDRVIHELRVDAKGRRLDWANIRDISPSLIKAVVRSEDRRFYEHSGVDWRAVGSAAITNLFSHITRGASTITMQVASMLDNTLKRKNSKKTFRQKWDQMKLAGELERTWTKEQILEAYLNLITFRGELQGISAASRGLFDKEQSGLNETEALVLASLIRSPNASAEDVIKRACALKRSEDDKAECADIAALGRKTLTGAYHVRQRVTLAPHVARALLTGGKTSAVSTLDGGLQRFASEVLRHHLAAVRAQNVRDGSVLVVDNKSGDVLAYVGGLGDESSARYVDGTRARRQAGSTLKPFLYATALE